LKVVRLVSVSHAGEPSCDQFGERQRPARSDWRSRYSS
jgi:hypothetical protein